MRSTRAILALTAIALAAAAAGAGYAWQKSGELANAKRELAAAAAGLEKARADARTAKEETGALRKEMANQKAEMEQLRSQVTAAGSFLEAEKTVSARLRQDLVTANDKLAARNGRPRAAVVSQAIPGMNEVRMIRVVPTRVIAIPAPTPGKAAVAAQPVPQ
jgi:septal ring factor EnvC (AmiA/AmiB activator)